MKSTECARRIRQLRAELQLTQHAMAELLHVRPQVLASWEQGRRVPSAESYRRLAALAPPERAWYFLEQMGVTQNLVRAKWPGRAPQRAARRSLSQGSARIRITDSKAVPLNLGPLLRRNRPLEPGEVSDADIESVIAVPGNLLPEKEDAYIAIRQEGNAMAPVLEDGFVVVVDQTRRNPSRLADKLVAAWSEDELHLRWLQPAPRGQGFLLRPENPAFSALHLKNPAADHILGQIVFWWGKLR
jgi:DNA-binding XRE family transcriptional regulator